MLGWRLKRLTASVWTDLLLWTVWIAVLVLTILLPIYLGAHYLGARGCYPHFNLDLSPDSLQGFVLPKPEDVKPPESLVEVEEDTITNLLVSFYPPEVGVVWANRTHSVARLPRTLYRRGTILAMKEVEDYSIRDVTALCAVNDLKARGLISLGVAVCNNTMEEDDLEDVRRWLDSLEVGVEDKVVESFMQQDLERMVELMPKLFPNSGLNSSHVQSLQHIIRPFEPSELTTLLTAVMSANLTDADLKVLTTVVQEAGQTLHDVSSVLSRIKPENIGPIMENLDKLDLQLSDFISDPALVFKFFSDPEKSSIFVNLQNLLPRFEPTDIEAFLVLSGKLEEAQKAHGDPDDTPVMHKLFSIPLDILLGSLPKLKLTDESKFGVEALELVMEDEDFGMLRRTADQLELLSAEGRQMMMKQCVDQQISIKCRDVKDRCPNGHVVLGAGSLIPLIFPGIIYSISTILHYRGSILQCGIGKPFNLPKTRLDLCSAWILLLLPYLLFMIPWTLCLIIYRQFRVWFGMLKEARGEGQPLEPDCQHFHNASSFGLLLGAGQGVLHLGVQAVILGVVLLAGDILLGMDKSFFISSTLPVTCISLVLVAFTLGVSHLSSQEACRLSVDLATPPKSKLYLLSSLAWLIIKVFVTVTSTILLSLLVYIDTIGFSEWRWSAVSLVLLLPLPLVQCLLYQVCVRTGAEHRYAWGLLASVIPVRFLDMERRRARLFLILSQVAWIFSHVSAWLLYAVFVLVTEGNDVVWRTWIPVIVPTVLIPSLISFLHWTSSLSRLYSAAHAHPDMENEEKRRRSFPPDWRQLTGSTLSSESLAQAGFFYSCRRLKSGEATCFSCGRQVVEWTAAATAHEAHKSAADTCPLYGDVKPRQQSYDDEEMSSSCIPQFTFLAINLLFRLASFLLFVWVFWESWVLVSPVIPSLVLIPILWLIVFVLLNPSIYYAYVEKSSLTWSLVSPLVPQPHTSIRYIAINLAVNTLLHFLLWAAMLGTSPAVFLLAWKRLQTIWPALLTLAVLSALSAIPYWYLSLKPEKEQQVAAKANGSKTVYVVSTSL